MNKKALLIITIIAVAMFLAACGEPASNNANTGNVNSANKTANNTDPLAVTTPTPAETTNNAPILSPVLKEYCRAKVAKDEAGLRKIYSSDSLKRFEDGMKQDNIKSLVEYLSIDDVTAEPCEARNEVINGDNASAEIRLKFAPNGIRNKFVKENGEWKMTDMPDTDASNAAQKK
jgi:hypothetical protein